MLFSSVLLSTTLCLSSVVVGSKLYAVSNTDIITSLELKKGVDSTYTLKRTSDVVSKEKNPGWLTLGYQNDLLYSVSNGPFSGSGNGSLEVYQRSTVGELTLVDKVATILGPVHSEIFNGGKAIVTSHYSYSAVQTFILSDSSAPIPLQNFTYTSPLGPVTSRQEVPHPHAAHVDPTDSFVLVPDLGSDLLRLYAVSPATSLLVELEPVVLTAGSGPRHAAFWTSSPKKKNSTSSAKTFCFVINELSQSITSFSVIYDRTIDAGIRFQEVGTWNVYGPNITFENATSAEVVISPDNKFLISSSRGDASLTSKVGDKDVVSDAMQTWRINANTGELVLEGGQIPAGGKGPRGFDVNKAGDLVAVGLQGDGRVVVLERDVATGAIGGVVASLEQFGEIVGVVWDE